MINSTDRMATEKAERLAAAKAARRAEEASIVSALRLILSPDEQLLGFARGLIAGGIKGRLNIGPEAFFAPYVNIGLSERRVILQHLHGETGRPSEILPHFFAIADIQSIHFADIETFGGPPAARLIMHLTNGQSFRLRLAGEGNFESASSLAEVFQSLTAVRKSASGPTQRVCASCHNVQDQPSKFCPYCGAAQMVSETPPTASSQSAAANQSPVEKVAVVVTEGARDLLDDALSFLRKEFGSTPQAPAAPDAVSPENVTPPETAPVSSDAPVGSAPQESPDTNESVTDSAHAPTSGNTESFPESAPQNASAEFNQAESQPAPIEPTGELDTEQAGEHTAAPTNSTWAADFSTPAPDFIVPRTEPAPEPELHEPTNEASEPEPASAPTIEEPAAPESFDHVTFSNTETDAQASATAGATAHSFGYAYSYDASSPSATAAEPAQPVSQESNETTEQPETAAEPDAQESVTITFSSDSAAHTTDSSAQESAPAQEQAVPTESSAAAKTLRVHFHIQHPQVQFNEVILGKDADEVVTKLKDKVVADLKFPVKLVAMRLSTLEFAQEIVSKYNQEEHQSLPRPNSCREFLHLVEAIGYATVEQVEG